MSDSTNTNTTSSASTSTDTPTTNNSSTSTNSAATTSTAPAKAAAAPAKPVQSAPTPAVKTVAEPVVAAPAKTPAQIAESRHVAILEELLAGFKTSLSAKIVTDAMREAAARNLSNVMIRILKDPVNVYMDVVWNFFVANAKGVLQESAALSGVACLPAEERSRMELAYMLFRKAVRGIDVGNAANVNKAVLTNILKCPKLVVYLSTKSKTVIQPAKVVT